MILFLVFPQNPKVLAVAVTVMFEHILTIFLTSLKYTERDSFLYSTSASATIDHSLDVMSTILLKNNVS